MSIRYSECVSVSLFILHAKRMCHVILSPLACLSLPYFSTLPNKQNDYGEKDIEHKMCAVILFTSLVRPFVILRRIQQDIVISVHTGVLIIP
jgi:hypothetical protein